MAELTVKRVQSHNGIADLASELVDAEADASSDSFNNDSTERTFLFVRNGGSASVTVSVATTQGTKSVPGFGQMTKSDVSEDVAGGDDAFLGPFPPGAFGSQPTITYSATGNVEVAAIKLGG